MIQWFFQTYGFQLGIHCQHICFQEATVNEASQGAKFVKTTGLDGSPIDWLVNAPGYPFGDR